MLCIEYRHRYGLDKNGTGTSELGLEEITDEFWPNPNHKKPSMPSDIPSKPLLLLRLHIDSQYADPRRQLYGNINFGAGFYFAGSGIGLDGRLSPCASSV